MRSTRIVFATTLTAAAIILAGCAGGASTPSQTEESRTLTLGATLDMYGWKPVDQPGYQNWAAEAVWDRLVMCDATGGIEPGVAETWEISDDSTTFTAHLRDGVEFSDGTPVDAAAVQKSFEYVAEQGGATSDYEGVVYDTPDDSTISLTWPEPQVILLNKVCNPYIVAPASIDEGTFDVPIGSGPYVLDEASTTSGSVYSFEKNPDYWNSDAYPFDSLVVKVLENDAAAVSALKTGQIDATLVGTTSVSEVEASGFDLVRFNGQTTRLIISDRTGKVVPALGDVRVRQAMNMVFDKEAMAKNLYLGNATPTPQVFREGTAAYVEGMEDPYPFDIDAAKKLMADAGYADGFELDFPTMDGQNFETLLPYVREQLAKINISVTEAPLSGANAIGDLLSGKYPVVLWQLGNLANSAQQIYIESTPDGWWNLQHEPDEYVDSRFKQLATASEEDSQRLQQEINQYLVDQAWFAPMVYMGTTFAYDADKVQIPTESDPEALTPRLRDFQ